MSKFVMFILQAIIGVILVWMGIAFAIALLIVLIQIFIRILPLLLVGFVALLLLGGLAKLAGMGEELKNQHIEE